MQYNFTIQCTHFFSFNTMLLILLVVQVIMFPLAFTSLFFTQMTSTPKPPPLTNSETHHYQQQFNPFYSGVRKQHDASCTILFDEMLLEKIVILVLWNSQLGEMTVMSDMALCLAPNVILAIVITQRLIPAIARWHYSLEKFPPSVSPYWGVRSPLGVAASPNKKKYISTDLCTIYFNFLCFLTLGYIYIYGGMNYHPSTHGQVSGYIYWTFFLAWVGFKPRPVVFSDSAPSIDKIHVYGWLRVDILVNMKKSMYQYIHIYIPCLP